MAKRARNVRVPVSLPDDGRPVAWLRDFRLSGFALAVLLLIVAALVVLAPGLKTFVEQRAQIAALERSVEDARTNVGDLEREVDRWRDPAYIEAQARDRLFYVFPGDVSYIVVGDDGVPRPATSEPISDRVQAASVDWVGALLSSVYSAGLTSATPDELESPSQKGADGASG